MRKILVIATVLSLFCAGIAFSQDLSGLAMASLCSFAENVKVNPYVQAGFQHVGSNMNLPINPEGPTAGLLQIAEMDIELEDANFWTGIAGLTLKKGELLSLFASAGGILGRQLGVSGEIPISLGPLSTSADVDFTGSKVEAWYIQSGIGLGPILGGLYWDHFTVDVGEPRRGSVPLANQTLRGYVVSKTFAPYIGLAVPAQGVLATVIYSPLAWSNTTLALRTSAATLAELQYKWKKPGNLLSASIEYSKTLFGSTCLGLWGNYTWMKVRGNAELEFERAAPFLVREKDVTATMTKYVLQGGVSLGINF